ncbi:uncharacterized protein Triagg1_5839 [Trichoderma aggressivum f. europaeum]|uniref:Uncharacterized protein n=1 Tax=Trichoderma aggressivum f. europaeum TaxID=173218 RepID=A0AAE1J4W4_9HYPO|nr:hypothetical protein Triagg1_5839 [Trichoderma aggressivum f. europaeum]
MVPGVRAQFGFDGVEDDDGVQDDTVDDENGTIAEEIGKVGVGAAVTKIFEEVRVVVSLYVDESLVDVGNGVGIPGGNISVVLIACAKSALLQRISKAGADRPLSHEILDPLPLKLCAVRTYSGTHLTTVSSLRIGQPLLTGDVRVHSARYPSKHSPGE